MLSKSGIRITLLLVAITAALAILLYYISTPETTHEHHADHEGYSSFENVKHEHLYSDLVNSFNSNPESPIVCYRKNHRNFYVIIFFLAFVLLSLTTFFLFRFRRLNALVKRKNSELEQIHGELNASIDYASNLQKVVLPYAKVKELLPESFVLNYACQKIGGDFFWVSKHGEVTVLGVLDCTGHGVPGALISMISFDLLKRIIHEGNCENPAEILNQLNQEFVAIFDPSGNKLHDGLDASLVSIHRGTNRILFAGAGNGFYFTDGQEWNELKGSRQGIGGYAHEGREIFENKEIQGDTAHTYYLFTDGFPDQFGGPNNKKLGKPKVREFLKSQQGEAMERVGQTVSAFLREWQGKNEQNDDITVIGFKL